MAWGIKYLEEFSPLVDDEVPPLPKCPFAGLAFCPFWMDLLCGAPLLNVPWPDFPWPPPRADEGPAEKGCPLE